MADTSLFGRLRRLFSSNVIVRNVGGKKLRIADTDKVQAFAKKHYDWDYSKIMNRWILMVSFLQH